MKKYFFTGFIILLPAVLTLLIIVFLFDFFTTPFVPLVTKLLNMAESHIAFTFPLWLSAFIARVIALVLLWTFVLLLGCIARWFLIRNLLHGANKIFSRIPVVRTIFNVSRDIFSALFAQDDKKVFKRPIMMPFPAAPNYTIGYLAGEVPEECQKHTKDKLVSVFSPTAPHPTSGFLFLVPEKDIYETGMSNEEGVKYLVSCGAIIPEAHADQ